MIRKISLSFVFIALLSVAYAQEPAKEGVNTENSEKVEYKYTPIDSVATASVQNNNLVADSAVKKEPGRFVKWLHRLGNPAKDKTLIKKIDFTFVGGPFYTNSTSVGIGILAAGLYRIDKENVKLAPSNVSIFGSASVKGLYQIGVEGTNIFKDDKRRLNYLGFFMSLPRAMWGFGYEGGRDGVTQPVNPQDNPLDPKGDTKKAPFPYTGKHTQIQVKYLERVFKHAFVGAMLDYSDIGSASDPNGYMQQALDMADISYQRLRYRSASLSVLFEYDSRDFPGNAFNGLYFSIQGQIRPGFASNILNPDGKKRTVYGMTLILDYYKKVWKDCVLALDFYTELHSQGTPWVFQAQMGGSYRMRGYYRGRFSDLNTIMFQAELRQRFWKRFGCAVWVGAGNVFNSFSKYNWSEVLPNYGVGLRWEFKHRMNLRLDYGFGKTFHHKDGKKELVNGFIFSINEAF